MKLHDWHIAPNPRRLHIYLAEKGVALDLIEVGQDDMTLAPWYCERYPHAMVPMLELDDGTPIGEVMSIARYFEDTQPEPPLMGRMPKERAVVDIWERRANEEGMLTASELFRNTHPNFAARGLPGAADPIPAVPELRDRARARLGRFFRKLDRQLVENAYVAGPEWSVADAAALAAVDFAGWTDVKIPGECRHLQGWYERVNARPSARA